ncbi:MAG: sulfite exporter TauE/SafE family protein [Actinomycetota bacterium]
MKSFPFGGTLLHNRTNSDGHGLPTGPALLVGVAAGLLSGVFGVGGGILIVPGLVFLARMDQRTSHGTSLAAVLPIAASSLVTYWAHDHVDWPVAAWLVVGAVIGAVAGTALLNVLPHRTLAVAFSVVLLVSAIRLFISMGAEGRGALNLASAIALVVIGLVTGILSGLLGVGGGVVMVPAMMMLLHVEGVVAKGTSLAVIIPTAAMGTWRNRSNDNVDLRAAGVVATSGIVAAVAGGWIAARMSDSVSNFLFATLLIVVAVRLLLQARRDSSNHVTAVVE